MICKKNGLGFIVSGLILFFVSISIGFNIGARAQIGPIPGMGPLIFVNKSFATFDPATLTGSSTLSNGNLKWTGAAGSVGNVRTTKFAVTKFYAEITEGCSVCSAGDGFAGSIDSTAPVATQNACSTIPATYFIWRDDGLKCNNGSSTSYGGTGANNQVMSIAVDNTLGSGSGKIWVGTCSAGTITWFASGNPSAGTNTMYSVLTGSEGFVVGSMVTGTAFTWTANFGATTFACNPATNNASGFGAL